MSIGIVTQGESNMTIRGLGLCDAEQKEGQETQPCVREHSIVQPDVHPWSTTRNGPVRENQSGSEAPKKRQMQGLEMENQPPFRPLIPLSLHSTTQSVHIQLSV
ncbi:hypothetical protein FQN60_001995, partial [Etheostoma spectabile]